MCDESPLAELRAEDRGRSIRAGCYARGWRGRKGGGAGDSLSLPTLESLPLCSDTVRSRQLTQHATCAGFKTSESMQEQNGEARPGHSAKQHQQRSGMVERNISRETLNWRKEIGVIHETVRREHRKEMKDYEMDSMRGKHRAKDVIKRLAFTQDKI
ncbi:unnamed protein product [Leuciscus chuanchicus]